MSEPLKPPFTYFGGKTALAERIAALLPSHEHYVEPFAGSLAVLLAKPRSRVETVNDLSRDLMTFWRVLRDRPADLERACALTPHSRAEHQAAYEPAAGELEQARRVWVRLTQGHGGHLWRPTGWHHRTDGLHGPVATDLAGYVSRMPAAVRRLAGVSLECRPALDLIGEYGQRPGNLIYADPPYLGSVRNGHRGYGHEMMTEAEHAGLAEALGGCAAAVVLSGYPSPLYDDLFAGWHRRDLTGRTSNAAEKIRTEVLWSNRPFRQGSLFDLEAS